MLPLASPLSFYSKLHIMYLFAFINTNKMELSLGYLLSRQVVYH